MTSDPRNRIVVFRIAEDEYRKLIEVSERSGARTLSDFMRSELLSYIHSGTVDEHLQRRFESLEERIQELRMTTVSLFAASANGGSPPQS
jgi:hypothetical protein